MSDNTKMREAFVQACKEYGPTISFGDFEFGWDACMAWQAARMVPEGWRFDRCSDGSINVIKDGHCGANVEQNAEQARRIPEEVLWMLANDMLSAAPEGKK